MLLWYSRGRTQTFNIDAVRQPYKETSGYAKGGIVSKAGKQYMPNPLGTPVDDVWDIPIINPLAKERLGYPTQKPESLLERVVEASSNSDDLVLDAYCGCGTTVAVAQRLGQGGSASTLRISPLRWCYGGWNSNSARRSRLASDSTAFRVTWHPHRHLRTRRMIACARSLRSGLS